MVGLISWTGGGGYDGGCQHCASSFFVLACLRRWQRARVRAGSACVRSHWQAALVPQRSMLRALRCGQGGCAAEAPAAQTAAAAGGVGAPAAASHMCACAPLKQAAGCAQRLQHVLVQASEKVQACSAMHAHPHA